MKLSELKTGESAVIVKVSGHGGFRKRVIEMGFIKGKKVDVLLNAPLQDPVKYKIMGYEVSLRHSEADHIEVVSIDEAKNDAKLNKAEEEDRQQVIDSKVVDSNDSDEQALGDKMLVAERKDNASNEALAEQEAERLHRVINVALVGNPNCGKTSLFNFASGAHERVGNYSGVTVDARWAKRFQRLPLQSGRFAGYLFPLGLFSRRTLCAQAAHRAYAGYRHQRHRHQQPGAQSLSHHTVDRYAHPHGLRPQYV